MTDLDALAFVAGHLNAAPGAAGRAARYGPGVAEVNRIVRETADAKLAFDATPLSFETLKAEVAGR